MFKKTLWLLADILFPASRIENISIENFAKEMSKAKMCEEIEGIYALFAYRNPFVRKMLWEIKYKGNQQIARMLAQVLKNEMPESFKDTLLIPIPNSKKQRRDKGFNQTELIAEHLSNIIPQSEMRLTKNVLKKIKDIPRQHSIKDKKQRFINIKDSFGAENSELIKNKTIILFDDIVTTGATLHEAKRTLQKAGAGKVILFAVAH